MSTETLAVPKLENEKIVEEIYTFIKSIVISAHADGVVVGLSGGVDSSLTATLCMKALGHKRVVGVLMPTRFTPQRDMDDAQELASWLGIQTTLVNIQEPCNQLFQELRIAKNALDQRMPMANIYARTRMVILYYYANRHNQLVAGTSDRSEFLIGFFTKHGDGSADFFPIIHLYKTQVRNLANYLGIPKDMASKPSSPQLYPGHKATDEIPLDYGKLDPVLVGLFDRKLPAYEVSQRTNVPMAIVEDVIHRYNTSEHKRSFPPSVRSNNH
jgi:NAD+ synthase